MIPKCKTQTKLLFGIVTLSLLPVVMPGGQDRDRDRDHDRDRNRVTRLEPGTVIPVRTTERIDVDRRDNRVYPGVVDSDVRGTNGALAIPKGSSLELVVRVAPDNDLILDLESVTVNGQRFAIKTDPARVEAARDNSVVGSIIGALNGGHAQGRTVDVPRDSILTFRLDRPMEMGVADRGYMRDGHHYHDDDREREHNNDDDRGRDH